MRKASPNVPDRKAGVTPSRFRTRFPLTSYAPIAVEVREVEPLEVVRKRGRIAIHITPELADRIRSGDRDARLTLLRTLGRKLLFIVSPRKVFGGSKAERDARGKADAEDFATRALKAAGEGRGSLARTLAFAIETRAMNAPELTGWPSRFGDTDERRDAEALADVVLDLLNFGGSPTMTDAGSPS